MKNSLGTLAVLAFATLALVAPLPAAEPLVHTFTKLQLDDHFWSEGANVGDFNRDGKLDVVSGPFWYAGPDFKTKTEIYPPKQSFKLKQADGTEAVIPGFEGALGRNNSYSNNFFAFTHDFNGDQWPDVLVYGFPGDKAIWYENPQAESKPWTPHVVFNTVDNESPTWLDMTGDGKPEIVSGATLPTDAGNKGFVGYASVDWTDTTKPWTFVKATAPGGWGRFTHGLGAGDVNGDGKVDLLLSNGWYEQPTALQADTPWTFHPVNFGGGGAQMYVYDVNGDGSNDVITSLQAHGFGLAWFEQFRDGEQTKFRQHLIVGKEPKDNRYGVKFSQLHAIDLVDMDGDGLKDIVTGKRFWAHGPNGDAEPSAPAVLYWFKLVRGADKFIDWVPYLIDDNSGVGTQVLATDINGDGLPDIVVGNKKGTFVHLHHTKKVTPEEYEKAQPQVQFPEAGRFSAVVPSGPPKIATPAVIAKANPAPTGAAHGVLPVGRDGKPLNTDFETGDLRDWTATGNAFSKQPIEGDVINARRSDFHSNHAGRFWIGGYEVVKDDGQGTLTSAPFKVTRPWGAFLIAGGGYENIRVELVRADNNEVIYKTTAYEPKRFQERNNAAEELRPVVVDLKPHLEREIYLRVVDQQLGHWGHINFDDFKLYATRPEFKNEFAGASPGLKELGKAAPAAPADVIQHAGTTPEQAVKVMEVPPGFQVTLFAGEPDVQQPIAMAMDDRGRLWIAEAYSYPSRVPDDKARDRILIFEDTNGDGRFDTRKVFIEKLNLVSGMELGFGGVWVGAAPHFLFIPDRNGDDVPDDKPQVVLDGWGAQDTHETLNSFIWGPDGWLYGCHGVFTHSRVGKPGTPDAQRIPINAGLWRYHPVQDKFEVFSQGTSNPWGVDFNDRGQAFLTACVIPHLYHAIQGGRYQRQAGQHFNPYTYDDIKTIAVHRHYVGGNPHGGNGRSDTAGGGHAHAGAMIYLGGSWPAEYRDQIFMNNIHGARINEDKLLQRGSGYVGDRAPDFLFANDAWSQILYLTYGPDGGVYMIDWYDKNQCHHGNEQGHDRTNGRIFKVSAKTAPSRSSALPGDLKKLTSTQLVDLLLNENDWFVRHARRILHERAADPKSEPAGVSAADVKRLEEIVTTHTDETRRVRALWVLHVTGQLNTARLQQTLSNTSPYVRGWAVQLACEIGRPSDEIVTQFVSLAKDDPSPVVRMYLGSAAQRLGGGDAAKIAIGLVGHSEDAADHNLPLLYWYAVEPLVPAQLDQALSIYSASAVPLVREYLVRRLAQTGDPVVLAQTIQTTLTSSTSTGEQLMVLRELANGLKGRRQVPMPASWPAVFERLAASPNADVRSKAFGLSLTFGDPEAIRKQRTVLVDTKAPLAARLDALNALVGVNAPQLAPVLQGLLNEPDLQAPALRALAGYDDPNTPSVVLNSYSTFSPEAKRDALSTLASRPPYALALLNAVEAKQVTSNELSAELIRQLRNLKHKELDDRISKVWGSVRETPEERLKEIERLKRLLAAPPKAEHRPDLALGRAMFIKSCQQCHTLFGVGGKVGPELTGSNRANVEYVLSNVVDPSALIGKDYQAHVIVTTSGRVLTGLIRGEDNSALTLATATETIVVPKDEIEDRVLSPKSMMPEDVVRQLSEREFRSLVAYLASPVQTPVLATPELAKQLFNGKDLTGWQGDPALWSVENGELVGRTKGLKHNEFLKSELVAGDFKFSCEVQLVKNEGNSGIQFRSVALPNGEMKGCQADIGSGWWGKLYEENGRALLWKESGEAHVKPGEWTKYEIEAIGPRVRTWLNGQLCVDLEDPQGAKAGVLGLQLHSGGPTEVRYRNLKLDLVGESK